MRPYTKEKLKNDVPIDCYMIPIDVGKLVPMGIASSVVLKPIIAHNYLLLFQTTDNIAMIC